MHGCIRDGQFSYNQKRFRHVGLHIPPGYKRPGAVRALMPRPAVIPQTLTLSLTLSLVYAPR